VPRIRLRAEDHFAFSGVGPGEAPSEFPTWRLACALLLGEPVATLGRRELGDVGLWFGLLPIVLAIPFALPMLEPPAARISHASRPSAAARTS